MKVEPKSIIRTLAPLCSTLAAASLLLGLGGLGSCRRKEGRSEPHVEPALAADALPDAARPKLVLKRVRLFFGNEPRNDGFSRGESVTCRFVVSGFEAKDRGLRLDALLILKGPKDRLILRKGPYTAVDQAIPAGRSTRKVEMALTVEISRASFAGPHRLEITMTEPATGSQGKATARFDVRGDAFPVVEKLTLKDVAFSDPSDLLPGGNMYVSLTPCGFKTEKKALAGKDHAQYLVHLDFEGVLTDESKKVVHEQKGRLLYDTLSFEPAGAILEARFGLPESLEPGSYLLSFTVIDRISSQKTSFRFPFRLAPAGFGIYEVRIHGFGDVPRRTFYRKERLMVLMTLAGQGPTSKIQGDVAIEGPDGIYLVRKGIIHHDPSKQKTKATSARKRRYGIPVIIPEFIPTGSYDIHIRVKDPLGKRQASRKIRFQVTGSKLSPLPTLTLTETAFKNPKTKERLSGTFFAQGQDVLVEAVAGGMRLDRKKPHLYGVDLTTSLHIRDLEGKKLESVADMAQISRSFAFAPRRLRLSGAWRVSGAVAGWVLLQVEVLDRLSDRVSMRQRRIFIRKR